MSKHGCEVGLMLDKRSPRKTVPRLGSLKDGGKDLTAAVSLLWTASDSFTRNRLGLALLFILVSSVLAAVAPVFFKLVVDHFAGPPAEAFYVAPVALIVVYVLSQGLTRAFGELRWLVYGTAEQRIYRRLSRHVFAHVMQLPLGFHLGRKTGALSQTLAQGLYGYRLILNHAVFTVLPVVIQLLTIGAIMIHLYEPLFLAVFGLSILAYAITFTIGARRIIGPSEAVSEATIDANAVLTDSILNYETVKYFNAESHVNGRYDDALARSERQWRLFYTRRTNNGLVIALIFTLSLGATLGLAAHQTARGVMTVGDFVLINTYMLQIIAPLEMLGYAVRDIAQGNAFLAKLLELLRRTPEADEPDGAALPPGGRGELILDGITFAYQPERPILKDVSLRVPPGRTVAIVGPSGSGKSSLIRLLVRLYEPSQGRILLDGVPITDLALPALRQAVAVVPQDTVLFNDTIAYNIGFGQAESTREEVEQAARLAHIHEFVISQPGGYETVVGERGLKLSGGEKQRVAIARAAMKRPRMFLFDEATSSLDTRTERDILNNLIEVSRGTTTLIIAHRLSTVVHADEIVVLKWGEIVERGSHHALLSRNGVYASMWQAQQREREKDKNAAEVAAPDTSVA